MQAWQLQRLGGIAALVIEHHLEQRTVTHVSVRCEGLHQLLERQILVSLGAQRSLLDLRQQLIERHCPLNPRIQHLGIDEETNQAFGFKTVAVGHRHAHADVRLAAVTVQQYLE